MSTSPDMGRDRESLMSIVPFARRPWIGSLPSPLTPLIGRDDVRARVLTLLERDVRLVTLTGPGGIGKSRFAIALAHELEPAFVDGVAWVPLAAVRDADAVIPAIARALGIQESPGQPTLAAIQLALRDIRLMLVLDNFEQVCAAAPHVAALLASCPGLVALVTSRSLLRVAGEHAVPVPALDLPDAQRTDFDTLMNQTGAVRLFIERAQAVSPELRLTETDVAVAADICRQLEGVPLAIELAAARANHLPLPALRARLERRLPLLTGGSRDQPPRQRTMRDAIAWSYDLLAINEQSVFRHLSVFNGGCRLDALPWMADQQASSKRSSLQVATLAPDETIDTVARLTDHSLVRQLADSDGEPRFTMLETVREYARERLDEHGERAAAESAKAAYLIDLAERLQFAPLVSGSEHRLALLESEQMNIQETLTWLVTEGDREAALRLAGALAYSWIAKGHYREGQAWLEPLLANRDLGSAGDRARALAGLGYMLMYQGAQAGAEAVFIEALDVANAESAPLHRAIAATGLGWVHAHHGKSEEATLLLGEALALAGDLEDPQLAAFVASSTRATMGSAAHGRGDLALAEAQHLRALEIRRAVDFTLGVCRSLGDLGDVALEQGDLVQALRYYREAMMLAVEHWNPPFILDAFAGAARIAIAWGHFEEAATLLGAVAALADAVGIASPPVVDDDGVVRSYGNIESHLGETAFAEAWDLGQRLSLDDAIALLGRIEPPSRPVPSSEFVRRFGLTPRETEILPLLVAGRTHRQIGELFHISERTVESHVARLYGKLGVRSRAGMIEIVGNSPVQSTPYAPPPPPAGQA